MKNPKTEVDGRVLVGLLIVAFTLSSTPISAQILTGSITNYEESAPLPNLTFGDGSHSVTLWWSVANPNSSGYFYATSDTAVALATNVSSLSQIEDASIFAFAAGLPNAYYVGPVSDVGVTGGLNSFVVLRNTQNGYYGVARVDDIFKYQVPINHGTYSSYSGLNATWWFQSNGSSDFSVIPEPSATAVFLALTLLSMRTRKWLNPGSRENQSSYQPQPRIQSQRR